MRSLVFITNISLEFTVDVTIVVMVYKSISNLGGAHSRFYLFGLCLSLFFLYNKHQKFQTILLTKHVTPQALANQHLPSLNCSDLVDKFQICRYQTHMLAYCWRVLCHHIGIIPPFHHHFAMHNFH